MNKKQSNVIILGSTGSIGRQALDVIRMHSDSFRVLGLAAKDEVKLLQEQIELYKPEYISLADRESLKQLRELGGSGVKKALPGVEGLCELASLPEVDIVLVALSGAIGILPTLAAIEARKRVALANKETLVAAGEIVMRQARQQGAAIIPVDSEHSAIFQCLAGEEKHLHRIWLTASGGPFRDFTPEQLEKVNLEMALQHPNWSMGPKITIDSATLMNKGLEVIEAHHLFGVGYNEIEVLIQAESIIHSMVELQDGSFLAHLGRPDMRIPIQYALTYPERMESPVERLDFRTLGAIHFSCPNTQAFPALALAYEAGKTGGSMPAVLNAANEVAVNFFMQRRISFSSIPSLVGRVMEMHNVVKQPDLDSILAADAWARARCEELV
ncbi:MAG: 1-deoxy-D-xylulose-5-phosphate reductoisomerase [Syntrophomonas sp.]|uniref:1-deoxy-D-xylulose-5-phosphate reductoisomerase n=1 Tax=Syntrophomonas sp. TaxID=2053627 RepID=UPI002606D00B|nr:1-deoxy-D-xylulose-5-phosphate reductoisomerase [Syntrophomonas sp.]MDD2510028.1 1-deoxy-D-xylulose-5-phosphate reductoisomerase [Syntrophomonas sp.]MDD3878634.1 1-deoxy-D-xylulose-5-phosphate reductoisomerase [Syntrophomonas sp.]MDD4626095.1 1-deoxy-D-xylulose-5-phosphate reductoisomerase [Syntrophomonas sp.]